eukprot:CAMPEP_0176419644 /NCGR_PEP_ID=MMETSP0127-20121128/8168_1 /TAXON_ID=938130 /ORGANISM="Platyophrya macrostoma, Strain WH" /LENGTH=248 /DNA_ID=CAMNT_0017800157 /DNA_START=94 /DNA_END=840 /DNA_ORIENTATION=+
MLPIGSSSTVKPLGAPAATGVNPSGVPLKRVSAVGDSFGLLGLQPVVSQQADSPEAANMLQLTRGFDLQHLQLQVVQTEPLFPAMHSLWNDHSFTVQPEFKIPTCYHVNSPKLNFQIFQKFQVETLFYVFYSMPRDVLQVAAAQELTNRDWRYHKRLHMWITRIPGKEPTVKHQTFEKGPFKIFNPDTWKAEDREDFMLEYSELDEPKAATAQQQSSASVNPQSTATVVPAAVGASPVSAGAPSTKPF